MIKYITAYENGLFYTEEIKWKSSEHYNHTNVYFSYEEALDYVIEVNTVIESIKR